MGFKVDKKLLNKDRSLDIFQEHPGMDSFDNTHNFYSWWKLKEDSVWAGIYKKTGILTRRKSRKEYQDTMNRLLTNLYKADGKKVGHLRHQYSFRKGTFYRNEGMTYTITVEAINSLEKIGLIKYGIGDLCSDEHYSYFQATETLLEIFKGIKIKDSNINYNPKRTVYLREAKYQKINTSDGIKVIKTNKDFQDVDYSAKRTNTLNNFLRKYNNFIQGFEISWDAPVEAMILHKLLTSNSKPDLKNTALIASFSGDMSNGGRMYRAFWINMPKALRPYLRIDGERLVDIDFNACHTRLLYKKVNQPAPYDIYLYDESDPKRSIAKKLMVTIPNFTPKPGRTINEARKDLIAATKLKGNHKEIKDILLALEKHHEPIKKHLYSGLGLSLQFQEATIMRKIMNACMKKDIPILPCHDGCSVRISDADAVEAIFRSKTGLPFSRDELREESTEVINKGLEKIKDMEMTRSKMVKRGFTEKQLYRMNGSLLSLQAKLEY